MTEIIKETISDGDRPREVVVAGQVESEASNSQTMEYLIYFFFGVLETLLAFRLILKIAGASLSSGFVGLIYGITGVFILPFEGIFRRAFAQGAETTSIFEPSALVAIIVYAVLAWGIVKLVRISSGKTQRET